jgi:predicted dehydrogenase
MTQDQSQPVRWAIFGTSPVARKFALDLRGVAGAELASVASRNPANAARFATDLGVARAADSYADALSGEIDAVYIATPPALHETHALMAIEAGCAALVEKPFAPTPEAATRIAEAARAKGVFAMEAMWTRFQPLPRAIRDHIASGALGELRRFEGRFLAANQPDPQAGLFNLDLGGGALMHRGIYPLSLARFFMGPITDLQAMAHLGDTGVDEDSVLLLRHGSGALSTIHASLRVAGQEGMAIHGTRGSLLIEGPAWRPTGAVALSTSAASTAPGGPRKFEAFRESGAGLKLSGLLNRVRGVMRRPKRIRAPFEGNGYRYEALEVMEALAAGRTESDLMPLDESIDLIGVVDRAQRLWQTGQQQ